MVYNCLPHFWCGLLPERDDDVEIFEVDEDDNWEEDDDLDEMM